MTFLIREFEKGDLSTDGIVCLEPTNEFSEVRIGQYLGIHDRDKEFIFGMADVRLMLHPQTQDEKMWETLSLKAKPKIIVIDTAFSHNSIDSISKLAWRVGACFILELVSQARAENVLNTNMPKESQSESPRRTLDIVTPMQKNWLRYYAVLSVQGTFLGGRWMRIEF